MELFLRILNKYNEKIMIIILYFLINFFEIELFLKMIDKSKMKILIISLYFKIFVTIFLCECKLTYIPWLLFLILVSHKV